MAERDAKPRRTGDHGVGARLVVKMDRGCAEIPGDAGEERRVAAVQVRVRELDAVAVRVDDRRQLQAEHVAAAGQAGVGGEPK